MTDSPPLHPSPPDPWSYPDAPPVAPSPPPYPQAFPQPYPQPGDGPAGYGPPAYGPLAYGPVPPVGRPPMGEPPPKVRWMAFDPEKPLPRWGMPDILLGLLLWLFGGLAIGIPVALLSNDQIVVNLAGLVGSWIGMAGYVVLIARTKGQGSIVGDFGFRFRWFDPIIGLAAGLATVFLVSFAVEAVANLFDAPPGSNSESVFGSHPSVAVVVVAGLFASIGAPLVEELFFRGLVLRSIAKRFGSAVGVIGSTVLFALMHWPGGETGSAVSLVCGIAVMGLVFALLTRWSRRLGPSICTHMTINGLASAVQLAEVLQK